MIPRPTTDNVCSLSSSNNCRNVANGSFIDYVFLLKSKMDKNNIENICRIFEIPEAGHDLVDFFFEPDEISLILEKENTVFTAEDIGREWADREYRRGVIAKTDDSGENYRINNFYYFLDVFAVGRREIYETLPEETRLRLDDWYIDSYVKNLDTSDGPPTTDRVHPLEEMMQVIDEDPKPFYLNYCDCRILSGRCDKPTHTCITHSDGINTLVDRGYSIKLTKEQAKEIVREADKAGLMHTSAMNGYCNCCGDCCYLFRAQKALGSVGTWPATGYIVEMDGSRCIACGLCIKRCHFDIFRKTEQGISCDNSACVGCGLCVNTCPVEALKLINR